MTTRTTPPTPHAQALRAWLDHLRRRWRVLTGLGVLARSAAAVAIIALVLWATDWVAAPVGGALVLFFGLALVTAGVAVYLLVRPLRTPPSDRQLARLAEERDASLQDVVVTATERLEAGEPAPFDGLLVRAAADRLPSVEPTIVIDRARVGRAGKWAAIGIAIFLASGSLAWKPMWKALQTARLYVAPPTITLTVLPGDARVVSGQPLRITARLEGLPSGATVQAPVLRLSAAGEGSETVSMRREGSDYAVDLPKVDRGFRYRVVSGSLSSREFLVSALEPARVKRIDLEYEFPSFTKLAPRRDEDGGDIYGPAGTKVMVRVQTDKPVARGALDVRSGEPVRLERGAVDTELAGSLTIDRDGAYRVGLTDVDGLASTGDTEYFIRVMDDQPPDVRVLRPGGDRQVTRLEEIVLEAQADDDHGIAKLELVYAVKGGRERSVPLHRVARAGEQSSASTSVTGAHTLYVEELDVQPGDFITYFARARDVSRGKRSTEARSDIFFLEVRPFNEEFFAAQSQAMMGAGGGAAADLLESQKEIIVATWKLQRRQIAGQSAQDVKAVGAAQGELRARAQAMAAQMSRGMPRRRGGQAAPAPAPGDENPLLRAAGSMARAETALNALKPNDAVPHEMAAYNELLKMQAEITRRQVSRQRSAGGGGGGRSGNQDLSALFDEELLRQQETNYENRNSGGQSSADSKQENSALDKLKELAKRQDEIAQRQRELARARAALKPEEIKRQLERLTREQEELRRETEALSQQVARQQQQNGQQNGQPQSGDSQSASGQGQQQASASSSGASGQSGRSGGQASDQARREGAEGSDRLKEAAEEMANAARELSRSNLDEAQARTDETLERLRELERRMSGEAVPDERRRMMGEMQLEARQVAEAQRKLADETRRAAGSAGDRRGAASSSGRAAQQAAENGAANGDALRRLAAEQQRLADRVDALEKRLGAMPRSGGDQDAARSAAAARDELARQRLGTEMRKTADAMRQSGGGTPSADSKPAPRPDAVADRADALAQAARQVAERLGAGVAGSPETRALSDQLAQLRSARERLDAAEARLREAARRASAEARQGGDTPGSRAGRPLPRPAQGDDRGQSGQQASGTQSGGSQSGSQSGRGGQGDGGGAQRDLARLQSEYDRALRETRGLMDEMGREGSNRQGNGRQDGAAGTPEHHEFSRSAPGTEAFKQDYARWDVLTKGVNNALEETESSLAQRLSERIARDRVHAGADERAPAAYADSVSRYYRSLARRPQQ